jgi:hypothetical protein
MPRLSALVGAFNKQDWVSDMNLHPPGFGPTFAVITGDPSSRSP